jgi:hypothetical protein
VVVRAARAFPDRIGPRSFSMTRRTAASALVVAATLAATTFLTSPSRGQDGSGEGARVRGRDRGPEATPPPPPLDMPGWSGDRERGRFGEGFGGGPRGEQGGWRGGGRGLEYAPEYLRRDLQLFDERLALDEGQALILESLLDDYTSAFEAGAAAAREKWEAIQPESREDREARIAKRDEMSASMRALVDEVRAAAEAARAAAAEEDAKPKENAPGEAQERTRVRLEIPEELREKIRALREEIRGMRGPQLEGAELEAYRRSMITLAASWRRERAALGRAFLGDAQAMLNEEQLAAWPEFDRELRRRKSLPMGRLAAESVDLGLILREAQLDPPYAPELDEALSLYFVDLDRALVARNIHLETGQEDLRIAALTGDVDRAAALHQDEINLRLAVREVNRRYADVVAAMLTEPDPSRAEIFMSEYRRAAFPMVYRPTRTARALEAAADLEDLTPEVAQAIADIGAAYAIELGGLNESIERAVIALEPDQMRERALRMAQEPRGQREGRGEGQREGQGAGRPRRVEDGAGAVMREAFDRRSELDQRYRAQLESVLTPEQIERLPAPQRERGGRGEGDDGDRRAQARQRFDRNGDGAISEDEREEARRTMRGGGAPGDR